MIHERDYFWNYCIRAEGGSRARAKEGGFPHSIDRYFIDELLVKQKFVCAVSGIKLESLNKTLKFNRNPFGPSLDRIIPSHGYVPGNCRIVCTMVNVALNEWGLENFKLLAEAVVGCKIADPQEIKKLRAWITKLQEEIHHLHTELYQEDQYVA